MVSHAVLSPGPKLTPPSGPAPLDLPLLIACLRHYYTSPEFGIGVFLSSSGGT